MAVQQANQAATKAITEVLAQESMKQKEEASKQNAETEILRKAASKAAPLIPNGHTPKAPSPTPTRTEDAASVPVISDDESNDKKKRPQKSGSARNQPLGSMR